MSVDDVMLNHSSGFLVGAAIGSGIAALAAERGGADFLLAINAGRLRNMGAPSIACMLPILDAAPLTEEFAVREILPQCRKPVYLGINCWTDQFDPKAAADRVASMGFAGVVNFPTAIHFPKGLRQMMAWAKSGVEQEIAMLLAAKDRGLSTMFYCATKNQARAGADAGFDMVCLNLGWNAGGAFGHRPFESLEEVAMTTREIGRLVKLTNPPTKFLLEGGPIVTPEDLGSVVRFSSVDGYIGGSTIERFPMENSIADQIAGYRHSTQQRSEIDAKDDDLLRWGSRFGFAGHAWTLRRYLQTLKALAATRHPLLLLHEHGADLTSSLSAISAAHGKKNLPPVVMDVATEEFPGATVRRLFGEQSHGHHKPAMLIDPGIELLVIRSPRLLSKLAQRRLARALSDGTIRDQAGGKTQALRARCILAQQDPGGTDCELTGLEPSLHDVFAGWSLRFPALKQRSDDIMALLMAAIARIAPQVVEPPVIAHSAVQALTAHDWPGNENELEALVGRLMARNPDGVIDGDMIDRFVKEKMPLDDPIPAIHRDERHKIADALWRHGYNRTKTAQALNISRKTLYNKIKALGLDRR